MSKTTERWTQPQSWLNKYFRLFLQIYHWHLFGYLVPLNNIFFRTFILQVSYPMSVIPDISETILDWWTVFLVYSVHKWTWGNSSGTQLLLLSPWQDSCTIFQTRWGKEWLVTFKCSRQPWNAPRQLCLRFHFSLLIYLFFVLQGSAKDMQVFKGSLVICFSCSFCSFISINPV